MDSHPIREGRGSRNTPTVCYRNGNNCQPEGPLGSYSCFEKGCPTKPYATMPKGIMGDGGSRSLIEVLGVSAT